MASLRWGLSTHEGNVRPQNEDNAFADGRLFVVADGMGGHLAGEVASEMVVTRLHQSFAQQERPHDASSAKGNAAKSQSANGSWSLVGRDALVAAVYEANGEIYDESASNPDRSGMGTTVAVITVVEDVLEAEAFAVANVGDSRIYRLRHGRLRQISIDHSFVQELVAEGAITRDEARTHPRRNIITRALGIDSHVRVDSWTLPIVRGDRYLLCSDGLVDEVTDDDIASILLENPDPQDAADRCVESALVAGGRDNVTVLIVDVLEGLDPPAPTEEIDVVPAWDDDVDEVPTGEVPITPAVELTGESERSKDLPTDGEGADVAPKPATTPAPKKKKKKRPPTEGGPGGPSSSSAVGSGSKPGTSKTGKPKSASREPGSKAASTKTKSTNSAQSAARRAAVGDKPNSPNAASKKRSNPSSGLADTAAPAKAGSAATGVNKEATGAAGAAQTAGTAPDITPRSMPRTRSRVADPPTVPTSTRRRGGASRFVLSIGVAAVFVLGAVIVTAWARSSYFIAFNSKDVAALYKGKAFLWFHPTEEWPYAESRAELTPEAVTLVEEKPTFKSPASADSWAEHNLVTTTTSTTTTTTVAPVVAPVSSSVPASIPVAPVPATPPVPPASTIGP